MVRDKKLWEKVEKEFPNDPALQEVHYARLKIHKQTEGMTVEEYIKFIKTKANKVIGEDIAEISSSH